jgi:hypothetical protein
VEVEVEVGGGMEVEVEVEAGGGEEVEVGGEGGRAYMLLALLAFRYLDSSIVGLALPAGERNDVEIEDMQKR